MNVSRSPFYCVGLLAAGFALGGLSVWTWERGHRPGLEASAATALASPPRCWEATVYLPLVDNQGKSFSDAELQEALALIVDRFGGATLGERSEGYWLDGQQRVHREPVRRVTVTFDRERLAEFRAVLRQVGERLRQESMYLRLDEPRVEFVPVAPVSGGKDP